MARKKNSGLGRGLDAIFLENADSADIKETSGGITPVRISLVDPKSDQPRKHFDKDALEELAASIREHGLLQPILVREYGEGRYQIIAGERRFRASKLAGLEEIPVIILDKTDREAAEIALIENIQREDLNPVEEALAYRALSEEHGLTQDELADRVGKSRSAVANAMRLLALPEEVLRMVAQGDLSAGHARTLLGLKSREAMISLAEECTVKELSVRALEELVKKVNKAEKTEPLVEIDEPIVDYDREIELRIMRTIGRRAIVKSKGYKKTLTLFWEDNEDLDELLRTLCGDGFIEDEE